MGGEPFKDRSDRFFGREADLQALKARLPYRLTAVVARPKMGKSWLLMELARRLSLPDQNLLVGFANSVGEYPDLFPRAVADLYQRWLGNASYLQQARQIWRQQKGNTLSAFAGAVGEQLDHFKDVLAGEPLTTLIKGLFGGLSKANQDLKDGGMRIQRLQYEQALEAVRAVSELGGGRRVVLIMDQWDNSPDLAYEARLLERFLQDSEDWPACHVVLAVRDQGGTALDAVNALARDYQGTAAVHRLQALDLKDALERTRLLTYVRQNVPVLGAQPDAAILQLVDGYPGVIYQWTTDYQHDHMKNVDDAVRVAADAQKQLYGELDRIVPDLKNGERDLAIRIALLPTLDSLESWRALQPMIAGDLDITLLDSLRSARILESAEPPSYGHGTRREAALAHLLEDHRVAVREQCQALIFILAAQPPDAEGWMNPAALNALAALLPQARALKLDPVPLALCHAAGSIRGVRIDDPKELIDAVDSSAGFKDPVGIAILSSGYFNAFEDAREARSPARMDQLLIVLQRFTVVHGDDTNPRVRLAHAIYNAYLDASLTGNALRRLNFLAGLRRFALDHPQEVAPCEACASALVEEIRLAKGQPDWTSRESLLHELKLMTAGDSAALHQQLAKGLFSLHIQAREAKDDDHRPRYLGELRDLSALYPAEALVAAVLAKSLFFECFDAAASDKYRRDALMIELRSLVVAHGDAAEVCGQYASALVNRLNDFEDPLSPADYETRFNEMGALANRFPSDPTLRTCLRLAIKGMMARRQDAMAAAAAPSRTEGDAPAPGV